MKLLRSLVLTLALGTGAISAHAGNVFIVLSESDRLDLKDGKVLETGFYLNELMQLVKALFDAGHEIVFATPKGTAPSVDKTSIDKMYFGSDEAAMKASEAQLATLGLLSSDKSPVVSLARVEQIGYDHFDAVYVPGGHAPMQDLVSPELGKLLRYFHEAKRPRWPATAPSHCCQRCKMRRGTAASNGIVTRPKSRNTCSGSRRSLQALPGRLCHSPPFQRMLR